MPAYVVFMRDEMIDPVEFEEYSTRVGASFEGHDMKALARYGTIETLEGDEIEGAVILEFPDMDAARAWYRSPEYQATVQHRFKAARYRGFIVAGL
jgi:uncharacterized protein (DUF1330 family)